jgi:hypothetical protein
MILDKSWLYTTRRLPGFLIIEPVIISICIKKSNDFSKKRRNDYSHYEFVTYESGHETSATILTIIIISLIITHHGT